MTEQELKKEQFIAKAMENKEKFALHKKLIEEILCVGGKMYIEDLKVFAERQVVDNQLLLNLMEYAENFAKETMKKAIIIIGEETSGKSRLSRGLAVNYKKEEIALIDGRLFNFNSAFPFQNVTKQTKVLIIDEILKTEILDGFFSIISGNLIVNQKHKEIYEIKLEKLIIVCDSRIKKSNLPTGASFTRRFEILDTKDFFITEEENNRKIVDYANVYFKEQQDFISRLEQQNQNLSENNKKYLEIINWIKEAFGENVNEDYGHSKLNGFIDDFLKDNISEVV